MVDKAILKRRQLSFVQDCSDNYYSANFYLFRRFAIPDDLIRELVGRTRSRFRANFGRLESLVGWAKARVSRAVPTRFAPTVGTARVKNARLCPPYDSRQTMRQHDRNMI